MHRALGLFILVLLAAACRTPRTTEAPVPGAQVESAPVPSVPTFAWNEDEARMELSVPTAGGPWLYAVRLSAGLGSNDVGLDRGQLGPNALIEFRRHGDRLLMIAPNVTWRTSGTDPAEVRGVREAFAESVLFGFDVADSDDEMATVDATDFLLRDAHDIARKLARSGQGNFRMDASRSLVLAESAIALPANSDVETLLTFTADDPGSEVRSTAADSSAVSLRLRHAFIELPETTCDYEPRRFHPGGGFFPHTWRDLAAPLGADLVQRVIRRHHLCAEHPIVYYIDRAAPEPVRTALLEGARYWAPVFERAGFPGGFRAELLPEDADPHDVRYNVVQWVNRSTRGWSYGMTLADPRDGRILKGHVTLGALRVRQDVLLMEGLLAPYDGGEAENPRAELACEVALDRIRQLSAHEIGHTLGLAHNFAASTNGRASVMDYPAPLVTVGDDGELDLSRAYAPGCGAWDEVAIRFGYGAGSDAELDALLRAARRNGLVYLSDADARGAGRSHPAAALWDNGDDPLLAFDQTVATRAFALARFSASALRPGRPLSELENVLVPLYLHHRYQLEALARLVGGRLYHYALRGEQRAQVATVAADRQRAALVKLLSTLDPAFLALPRGLSEQILPSPPGHGRGRESFEPGARLFDPIIAAEASITLTLEQLLNPARLERLVDQHALDTEQLGLGELFDVLDAHVFAASPAGPAEREVHRAVEALTLDRVAAVFMNENVPVRVRRAARARIAIWAPQFMARNDEHGAWLHARAEAFLEGRSEPPAPRFARKPPGSPIGSGSTAKDLVHPWLGSTLEGCSHADPTNGL